MSVDDPERLIAGGYEARRDGRSLEAKGFFAEAVSVSERAGDQALLARAVTGLAQIERDLKNNAAARMHLETAASLYRELNDELRLASSLRHLADLLRHEGRVDESGKRYEEALGIYRENGTPPLELANALRGYALLREDTGDVIRAKVLWSEAGELYRAVGMEAGVIESKRRLALLNDSGSGDAPAAG